MRIWTNCKVCAELVFFDIEGVSPLDNLPVTEVLEEEFGPLDPKLIYDVVKQWAPGKEYKEVWLY